MDPLPRGLPANSCGISDRKQWSVIKQREVERERKRVTYFPKAKIPTTIPSADINAIVMKACLRRVTVSCGRELKRNSGRITMSKQKPLHAKVPVSPVAAHRDWQMKRS